MAGPGTGPRGRGAAAAVLLAALLAGLAAGCGGSSTADGLTTLAKVDGWRAPLWNDEELSAHFALVEIAYDEETARAAWRENVPERLPQRSGEPREAGRYGSFADVDLEEQVLVVYSSGQSGSCPGWLADLSVEEGIVLLEREEHAPGMACTDDYNAYRVVLAVDRDKVPAADELPTERALIDDLELSVLVTAYPAG